MNKTTIKKTLLLFGVCAAPLLFQACESSFLKSAMEALNPIPDVFVGMDWGDENSVYINPGSKSIDGTLGVVSGVFLNGGKSIWPNYDLAASGPNSSKKAWSIVSSDETNFPAGSLVTMLTNNSSPSSAIAGGIPGELITLSFGTEALCMENFVTTLTSLGSETGQVTYSFILTPAAFHGADSASMSTNTLTRNFNLILPTYTGYGKQWLERYMYGTISASWTEGKGEDPSDPAAGMVKIAGSKAALAAEARLAQFWDSFEFDGATGTMAVVSWETPPDLSKGFADLKNYGLVLSSIRYTANGSGDGALPVRISAPVEFTSHVGSVSKMIMEAIAKGTFSADPADGNTGFPYNIAHLGDTDDPAGTASGSIALANLVTVAWSSLLAPSGSIAASPLQNKTSRQNLSITFGPGSDDSPPNTLTFTVWVNQGP